MTTRADYRCGGRGGPGGRGGRGGGPGGRRRVVGGSVGRGAGARVPCV